MSSISLLQIANVLHPNTVKKTPFRSVCLVRRFAWQLTDGPGDVQAARRRSDGQDLEWKDN